MAKFEDGDEVILRGVVTRADDDRVSVSVHGYTQSELTVLSDYVEKAPASAKKRGMEGVLTRQ